MATICVAMGFFELGKHVLFILLQFYILIYIKPWDLQDQTEAAKVHWRNCCKSQSYLQAAGPWPSLLTPNVRYSISECAPGQR